jgi:hypothetical protein
VKAACKRRLIDITEINNIINNWELMSSNSVYQENKVAESNGIEEVVEDFLGEY